MTDLAEAPRFIADYDLLRNLVPAAENAVQEHYDTTKIWYPHEFIPYELGTHALKTEIWTPDIFPLPDGVRSALFINLLTEDNLPYYFDAINRFTGDGNIEIWREWSHRWTAEEDRHSHALRTFMELTGAVDPKILEDSRMLQVSGGEVPFPETSADGLAYVVFQELATKVAHFRTARSLALLAAGGNPKTTEWQKIGYDRGNLLIKKVGLDENFHHLLYLCLVEAGFQIDSSKMTIAVARQVINFAMPGTGIKGFRKHAINIAREGIYNNVVHLDMVLTPVLKQLDIEHKSGLSAEAEEARDNMYAHVGKLEISADRIRQRSADKEGAEEAKAEQE